MNDAGEAHATPPRFEAPEEEGVGAACATNLAVVAFYERLGYVLEERACFGKRREDAA